MVLSACRDFHVRLDFLGNLLTFFTLNSVAKVAKFCTQIFSRGSYLLGSNTYAKQIGQKIYNLQYWMQILAILAKLKIVLLPQCENSKNFLSLRFPVK